MKHLALIMLFAAATPAVAQCPADVASDQIVNVDDLMAVLLAWGPCSGSSCAADVDGSGAVDVDDVITVIFAWGPCPGSEAMLCEQTDGIWDPLSCGHYSCGYQPRCAAIIPGCDCGPGRNFVAGVGCVDDPSCPDLPRPRAEGADRHFGIDSAGVLRCGGDAGRGLGSSREIGQEIDLTVRYVFDAHLSGLFGYSHFFSGRLPG